LEPNAQRNLRLALAGLQAGCVGTLLMIGWWLFGELLQRRSPWIVPNLLATTFYGERAYRSGFMTSTWSGLAGTFAVYCVTGVVFALIGRERKAGWVFVAIAGAAGLAINWLYFDFVMRRLNPFVPIYSPDRILLISHLLYGLALATYPAFLRGMLPGPEPPPLPPLSDQEVGGGIAQRVDETAAGPRALQ